MEKLNTIQISFSSLFLIIRFKRLPRINRRDRDLAFQTSVTGESETDITMAGIFYLFAQCQRRMGVIDAVTWDARNLIKKSMLPYLEGVGDGG